MIASGAFAEVNIGVTRWISGDLVGSESGWKEGLARIETASGCGNFFEGSRSGLRRDGGVGLSEEILSDGMGEALGANVNGTIGFVCGGGNGDGVTMG